MKIHHLIRHSGVRRHKASTPPVDDWKLKTTRGGVSSRTSTLKHKANDGAVLPGKHGDMTLQTSRRRRKKKQGRSR